MTGDFWHRRAQLERRRATLFNTEFRHRLTARQIAFGTVSPLTLTRSRGPMGIVPRAAAQRAIVMAALGLGIAIVDARGNLLENSNYGGSNAV